MLVGIREYFDSSSIHGLAFISSTKHSSRVFWTAVVLCSFLASGYLIERSFSNWFQYPVSTTEQTLPIDHASLPLITVCPPKDTFTNLNYDLMKGQNRKLENDTINLMAFPMYEIIQQEFIKPAIAALKFIKEKNKNRNFYNGYDAINLKNDIPNKNKTKNILLTASSGAVNGSVSSPYFGELYSDSKFFEELGFYFNIEIPEYVQRNQSIFLFIKIKSDIVVDQEEIQFQYKSLHFNGDKELSLVGPVTSCYQKCSIIFKRLMSASSIKDWTNKGRIKMAFMFSVFEKSISFNLYYENQLQS